MFRRLLLAAIAAGTAAGGVGCRHNCCNTGPKPAPQPFLPSGPGVIGAPSGGSTIPPAGVPTTPAPTTLVPPVTPSGSLPPPDPLFAAPRNFRPTPPPPPPPAPKNGGPPSELLLPDPLPSTAQPRPPARSQYPATTDPTRGVLGQPQTPEPPVRKPAPAAPAGLPGFTPIKENVATGRKPTLEGFDNLKQNGYKTVVYLHAPGGDVSRARELAQTRDLVFRAIETTPESLADALAKVNDVVADRNAQPAYVYDDDGLRAGAVWYLHFRTVDGLSADVSRIRATGIGLTDQTDAGRAYWVAIQQYMATR